MSKKRLNGLKQIHGKNETFEPTTLEQVFGSDGLERYKTLDESEYMQSLNSMNKADLQAHAVMVGILPTDNRDLLVRKLLKEFRLHSAAFRTPKSQNTNAKMPSETAKRILAEGR